MFKVSFVLKLQSPKAIPLRRRKIYLDPVLDISVYDGLTLLLLGLW